MFYKKRGLSTRLIANLAVLAVMSAAYPALADPSCRREGPVSSEALGEGRRLFEEGVRAADAGDWERARRYYLEACQQIYDPNIFANLGQANFELKRYRDAAESLSLFIHGASALPGGGNREAIKRAGQMLERAKARIGTVTIRGVDAGAEIFVNGRLMGRARDTFYIEPGLREFVARMPSGEEVRSEEVIKSGTVVDVNLAPPMTMLPALTAVPPNAWKRPGPRAGVLPDAGGTSGGGWSRTLITAGTGGLIGGGILIGVGAVFHMVYMDQSDGVTGEHMGREWAERMATYKQVSTTGLVVGGIGAGLGAGSLILGFVLKSGEESSSRADTSIAIGAGGTGASVKWTF
ncbi:MAG: hypothetical protein HUU21_15315 [Polyangiaceae bacterium]|nr:hypothetical protein [Polyangiaceae bacterium]